MRTLPGWELRGRRARQFTSRLPEAVAFVVQLAFEAESVDHPDTPQLLRGG
jgi:pterin-4a-carbinolamine dehydratase